MPGRANPATHGQAPGRTSWLEVEEYMAPTCQSNELHGSVEVCAAALTSCTGEDQMRFWVWQQETRVTLNPDGTQTRVEEPWRQLPGSFCLGPDDPALPTIGQVLALIRTGFQDLPLPKAAVQVDPAPTTLVNVDTAFYAGGAQSFTDAVTPVPGITVTVTAEPTSWEWFWGDGGSDTFTTAGEPKRPVVAHTYREARDHSAYVRVTWKGSFTLAGSDEVFDIATPAFVDSAPVSVQVREARTQLVDG